MANTITFAEVTDTNLDGSGAFDKYMTVFNKHVKREYDEGRINKSDYAMVYTKLLEVASMQASNFVLTKVINEKQADKIDSDIRIDDATLDKMACELVNCGKTGTQIDEQTAKIIKEKLDVVAHTDLTNAQIAQTQCETLNCAEQRTVITATEDNVRKTTLKLQKETLDVVAHTDLVEKQTSQVECETQNCSAQHAVIVKTATKLDKETLNIEADTLVKGAKKDQIICETQSCELNKSVIIANANKLNAEVNRLQKDALKIVAETTLIPQQRLKLIAETSLIYKRVADITADINLKIKDLQVKDQEILLMIAKVTNMNKNNLLIDKQIIKIGKEITKMDQEILVMVEEVKLMKARVKKMEADADLAVKQLDLLVEQIELAAKDVLLRAAQVSKMAAEVVLLEDEHDRADLVVTRMEGEAALAQAQAGTETNKQALIDAQTDEVKYKYTSGADSDSIMGAQVGLVNHQKASYKASVVAQGAKIIGDGFNVSRTQDLDGVGVVSVTNLTSAVGAIESAFNP